MSTKFRLVKVQSNRALKFATEFLKTKALGNSKQFEIQNNFKPKTTLN